MEKLICHKSLSNNFDVACNLLESIPVISAVVTHYLKEFVKPSELCVIILQMRKLKIRQVLKIAGAYIMGNWRGGFQALVWLI